MISAVILTKNSAKTLKKTLDSLIFLKEVLVVDTGSFDETLAIAKAYPNVRIKELSFSNFGALRNKAAFFAKHDWILSIDSDESLSLPLQQTLKELSPSEDCIYGIVRQNYYRGKKVTFCGWQDEKRLRLYHRKNVFFSQDFVHEKLEPNALRQVYLQGPLLHSPFSSQKDLIAKIQRYSDLFAKQRRGQSSSYKKACMRGLWTLFRSYFLQRGIFYGEIGWTIALYKALSCYYKYAKLAEINRNS